MKTQQAQTTKETQHAPKIRPSKVTRGKAVLEAWKTRGMTAEMQVRLAERLLAVGAV